MCFTVGFNIRFTYGKGLFCIHPSFNAEMTTYNITTLLFSVKRVEFILCFKLICTYMVLKRLGIVVRDFWLRSLLEMYATFSGANKLTNYVWIVQRIAWWKDKPL